MHRFASLLCFLLTGCAHDERIALDAARKKATFDLNCRDVIEAQVISRDGISTPTYEIGTRGCGKTETYKLYCEHTNGCRFLEYQVRTREEHVAQAR